MAMILTPRPRPYTSNETLHEHYSYVGKLEGRLKDAPEGSTLTTVLFLIICSEGERVLALESREGTRASRRVEEGFSMVGCSPWGREESDTTEVT